MRRSLKGRGLNHKREQLAKKLLDGFEDEPQAVESNVVNEKALNKMMNKVIRAGKKHSKPIDTRVLLKQSSSDT